MEHSVTKAVIFDLFETLVTEWGHEKYTKRKMCEDLGVNFAEFAPLWEELHDKQYRGYITFKESLQFVCSRLGVTLTNDTIKKVTARRISTKAACFESPRQDVLSMLGELKNRGFRLAILSNCSEEEVTTIRESSIAPYFDAIVLSYDTGLCKPESDIYQLAADRIGVDISECIFVGDVGSRELYGASEIGIPAYRAMWYISEIPTEIEDMPEFEKLCTPNDVLSIV